MKNAGKYWMRTVLAQYCRKFHHWKLQILSGTFFLWVHFWDWLFRLLNEYRIKNRQNGQKAGRTETAANLCTDANMWSPTGSTNSCFEGSWHIWHSFDARSAASELSTAEFCCKSTAQILVVRSPILALQCLCNSTCREVRKPKISLMKYARCFLVVLLMARLRINFMWIGSSRWGNAVITPPSHIHTVESCTSSVCERSQYGAITVSRQWLCQPVLH